MLRFSVFSFVLLFSTSVYAQLCIYRVKRGDTLSKIALRLGVSVRDLKRYNKFRSVNRIYVGQRIFYPCSFVKPTSLCEYRVKKGETLFSISRNFSIPLKELLRLNRKGNPNRLKVGERIYIPCDRIVEAKLSRKLKPYDKKCVFPKIFRVKGMEFYNPLYKSVVALQIETMVDIPVKAGEYIYSTGSGKVKYFSNSISGMSTLLIIGNVRGFYSVYAGENIQWFVTEGVIMRGRVKIGRAKSDTILHFQLKYGQKEIDPKLFLECGEEQR